MYIQVLKSGARWRDLPARYGNWNSIYHKSRQWCEYALFTRLLNFINADAKDTTLLELDSTFCKMHQSSCSKLKSKAVGSSRGGKNTKIHVLINEKMHLLNMVLTGGQIHDNKTAITLLKGIKLKGKKVFADKVNSKVQHDFYAELYKKRNIVERFFQRIKNYRHIAARYDKLETCFENFILLASAVIHF